MHAELSDHSNEDNFDRVAMKKTAIVARQFFLKKYTINMTNQIACFLDPRYRSLEMLNDDERNEVYDRIKVLIRDEKTADSIINVAPVQRCRFSHLEGSLNDNILDEFELYMRTADYSSYLKDDQNRKHFVESFWRDNKNHFPQLFKLVRKRLHVPASSGSSERVFSDAGRTLESRRTKQTQIRKY